MDISRKLVMLVDDSAANLKVGKNALSEICDVYTVPSAKKMFDLLERNSPSIILLDVEIPDMDGYETIKIFKASDKNKNIPVIFLTSKNDIESKIRGLDLGAMVAEQTRTVVKLQNAIIMTVAELVECRDDMTGGHIESTRRTLGTLSEVLIETSTCSDSILLLDIPLLLQSSQLHDMGKIAVSDYLFKRPGKLTEEEYNEMKKHMTFGVSAIKRLRNTPKPAHFWSMQRCWLNPTKKHGTAPVTLPFRRALTYRFWANLWQ
jgi:putative two-component system response regulator